MKQAHNVPENDNNERDPQPGTPDTGGEKRTDPPDTDPGT